MGTTLAEMSSGIYQNGDKAPLHDTLPKPKPVAIIGMGCRLPAKATNVENLWTELANGQSGWAPHPPDRYRADKYYHPNPDKKGCFDSKGAHYLEEDVARFDAQFFNVTGAEAIAMDPQQRHLLEVSYEALENAGIPLSKLAGTNTGVFVGGSSSDYHTHLHMDLENSPMFEPIGNEESLLSNRLSYTYDLKGPSMALDTACSSSLSALHMAFRSLQTGESSVAIVGGSHLNIRPETSVGLSTMRLLSPDGRSYAFDERATSGFGRGEGTVCIILKPLDAALQAGDPIRAIVRNTGANQDGKTAGVTMPNGSAQAALMRSVYKSAGLNPLETSYIEAHGTGTATGDPIEATALGEVFQRKSHQSPLIIGSLKSNIGHLEGASGVASVLKTALMLERKFIPPNFDFRDPNREIPFKKWNMKVSSKLIPWEPPGIRRASINNFGFGGSNAHIIMEESVPHTGNHSPNGVSLTNGHTQQNGVSLTNGHAHQNGASLTNGHAHHNGVSLTNGHAHQNGVSLTNGHAHQNGVSLTNGHAHQNGISPANGHAHQNGNVRTVSTPLKQHVYIFSASDRESLERLLSKLTVYVKERPVVLYSDLLDDLAFTLGQRRSILSWKFAFSASTADALFQSMTDPTLTPRRSSSQPSIGFLFTGQGSQWATMGRGLYQAYPAYASAVRKADDALRSLGASWSLIVELEKPEEFSNIDRPYISQPASTALQIALVELLRSWGVYPQKVVGHSSGEIAAAYSAGILDLEACMAVAYWRGVVSTTLSEKSKYVRGGMIAIGASQELTQALIDDCVQGKLVIACLNSPSSMTVSGDQAAISEIQHLADKRSVWNRRLKIDVAYHSHHMLHVADKYRSLLGDVQPNSEARCSSEFFSSLIGRMVDPTFLDTSYWVENLTSQVQFSEALKLLCEPEAGGEERHLDVLVEVGPHSALQGPARQVLQTLKGGSKDIQYCASLVRGEDSITAVQLLAARLFMEGCQLDMGAVNFPNPPEKPLKVLTDLPTYQWNHSKRFWHENRVSREAQLLPSQRHDLLGSRVPESSMLEPQWKNILLADNVPWLRDHKVQGLTVFPMAGYLCMAMEAYRQQASWRQVKYNRIVFREISVHQALSVPESTPVELRVSLAPHAEGPRTTSDRWSEFKVFSWTSDRDWLEHCRGLVASESSEERNNPVDCVANARHRLESSANDLERLKDTCIHPADAADIYRVVAEAGFEYGPTFRHMENVMIGPSVVRYKAIVPDSAASMPCCYESGYTIHPITLDLIFQSVWPLITNGGHSLDVPYMPIAIRRMEVSTNLTTTPGAAHQVIARMEKADLFSKKPSVDVDSLDQTSHFETADVSIRGLIGAPIQGSATRAEVEKARCFKTQWEPCISYLTQSQSSAIFSLPPPASKTIDDLWILERLSCDYMGEALSQTALNCINAPHLKKLYHWMDKQVSLVQKGQNHNIRPELLCMSQNDRQALRSATTLLGSYGHLIRLIGENLSAILRGEIEPLAIMLEDNLLSRFYAELNSYQRRYAVAANYIQKLSHQNPALRLIEIGGGTASATVPILEALGGGKTEKIAGFAAYDFTDITSGFFETAKARLSPWGQLIDYRKLDIEALPADQGFQAGSYDVVVASDVLHATATMRRTMANVHSLLKPGGELVLVEETGCAKRLRWLPFATLPGWWLGDEHGTDDDSGGLNVRISRDDGPLMTEEQWAALFSVSGFSGLDSAVQDYPDHPEQSASVMFTTALPLEVDTQTPKDEIVIIGGTVPGGYFWSEMETLLQKHSPGKVTWLSFSEVADFRFDRQYCILIDDPEHQYLDTMNSESFRGLQQALQCPGVVWVTGSLDSPGSGMVKGLCRTIRSENPNTLIVTLAIEDWTTPRKEAAILISDVFERSFYPAITNTEQDTEFAEKNGLVCVPRFVEDGPLNDSLNREFRHDISYPQSFSQPGRPLKLTISSPGFLDTLCFVDDEIAATGLPDDEIEIDIKASGLNFKDVILALGQLAGNHIGQECSGKVKRVGSAVTDLKAGDRVCSVTQSSIANFGRCKAACATTIPDSMSYLEAASFPIIYCTAQYCLSYIARLQPGETVLIHAAAGGVGQAAIMLAQATKAKILTTVGSLEKKTFLMQTYNIPEECIFYSRDTSFAQGIMDATAGKGVDVVLNSLAGEQMRATWECMAPFGRFVEIGKRDITSNLNLEMSRFERNVSFTAVDLTDLVHHRQNILHQLLVEVVDMFDRKIVRPVSPIHKFGVSEVETAFRSLQSGKLMGKLVIVAEEDEMVMATRPALEPNIFHPDVSYLITGGTGGIGRAICRWMVHQGARNVILASRSGLTQRDTQEMIESLRPLEAKIEVRQCDVSMEADVQCMVSECAKIMPPIGGVIHGAFVSKDVLFDQAEYSDWTQVIQPKVQGAWNLHSTLFSQPLDFFILLSSASGIVGNRGQAAYAAASSFLDSFAHFRASKGLPATALDLGVVSEIGWVAERPEMQQSLEALTGGSPTLTEADVLALIKLAVTGQIDRHADHQTTVGFSLHEYHPDHPSAFWASDARFSHLRRAAVATSSTTTTTTQATPKQSLKAARSVEEAVTVATQGLLAKFSNVLIVPVEEIAVNKPVVALGLDSLIAVEVRSWITREMEAAMTTMELMTAGSIGAVAEMVVARSKLCEGLDKGQGLDKGEGK